MLVRNWSQLGAHNSHCHICKVKHCLASSKLSQLHAELMLQPNPYVGMDMRGGDRGGPPGGMGGPGRGGPMGKPGGNMEGDRWGKRALPPPPPGTGGGAIAGLPALHKTDNKFKVRALLTFLTCSPCSLVCVLHRSMANSCAVHMP